MPFGIGAAKSVHFLFSNLIIHSGMNVGGSWQSVMGSDALKNLTVSDFVIGSNNDVYMLLASTGSGSEYASRVTKHYLIRVQQRAMPSLCVSYENVSTPFTLFKCWFVRFTRLSNMCSRRWRAHNGLWWRLDGS